ncbi:MAG: hypothetical protein O2887_14185 [Bacteroidetes bacterium]|nr:hypothetical protein [Bacteroidota bacterium]MDA1121618.1 hypothetical protein [Bacteroidota bacterium]
MTDKYQNKYRIPSARLPHWDYGSNAAYFVTICTQDRVCYFGDITENYINPTSCVCLSEIGKIANDCWLEIPQHFPFVKLGDHIVMPNHVHGIVIIAKPVETQNMLLVETQNIASLPTTKNKFGPQSQNLASIIRGFKIGVTKNARQIHVDFAWQSRFHDHIIRDDKSFRTISEYIINNPLKWHEDKFFAS